MAEVVAGLALGAVPLLAAALEQYRMLYRLCKRFKKCKSGIEELLDCLKLQRIIFKNETRLLLTATVGPKQAKAMVQDSRHSSWSDPTAESRLDCVLGDSKDDIVLAAKTVCDKMKRLEEEIQRLDAGDTNTRCGSKEWAKVLRGKFKFTFSEEKLTKLANSIRRSTKDYRVLRAQVQDEVSRMPEADADMRTTEEIERIQTTQAAAKRVYEVLIPACKLHTQHHARFSLNPTYASSTMGIEIKFQIAYSHLSQQQVQGSRDVLWFVVESIVCGNVSAIPPAVQLQSTASSQKQPLKRRASAVLHILQNNLDAQAKRVRFRSPSPPAPSFSTSTSNTSHATATSLPDLGTTTDFCTQLRACCTNSHQTGTCIGWLENSALWKHRVYHSSGPSKPTAQGADHPYTLAGFLASLTLRRNGGPGFSVVQQLPLAKLLSMAMLNFHSTPWISSSWTSQDIILYNTKANKNVKAKIMDPDVFVEVSVRKQAANSDQQKPFDVLATFVRNTTIFSPGVILLELAFEEPLQGIRSVRLETRPARGHS